MYSQLVGLNGSTVEMCSSTETDPADRCYLRDADPTKNPIGRNASLLAQMTVSWSTLLYDTENRNELLHDQFEIYRRGVAGEARPACCPAPFDVENNWMHEFPTAYVIPVGAGQRSNAEANRLAEWLIFNGIQVTKLRDDAVVAGQNVERGSYVVLMNQAHRGLAETSLGIGVDVSSRIGILYAPPAAWSHGYLWGADVIQIPTGVAFTAPTTAPINKPTMFDGGVEAGQAEYYALALNSATAVRTLNSLLGSGLTAKLALAQFTTPGGRTFPAGTVLFPFDPATKKTLGDAGREAGILLRRVHSTTLQLDDIDRSPRIAVFANALDQSVWSLRNLGFTADPVGWARPSSSRPGAPQPGTGLLNGSTNPLVELRRRLQHGGLADRSANGSNPGQRRRTGPAGRVLRRRRRLHRRRLEWRRLPDHRRAGDGPDRRHAVRERPQRHRLLEQHGRRQQPDHRCVPGAGHGDRRSADLAHVGSGGWSVDANLPLAGFFAPGSG